MYDFGMYDVRGNKKATLKVAFLFVEFLRSYLKMKNHFVIAIRRGGEAI